MTNLNNTRYIELLKRSEIDKSFFDSNNQEFHEPLPSKNGSYTAVK